MANKVSVIMGSASDLGIVKGCTDTLKDFRIGFELKVLSAHRSPKELEKYIRLAEKRGVEIFIAAAGGSAALAGVIASRTTLPVIGIPIPTKDLKGLDSLLSTVQMPGGVPVAAMAVGSAGAKNAAIFAAQILSLTDKGLRQKLAKHKRNMTARVLKAKIKL